MGTLVLLIHVSYSCLSNRCFQFLINFLVIFSLQLLIALTLLHTTSPTNFFFFFATDLVWAFI